MPKPRKILLLEVDIDNEKFQMALLDGSKWLINPGDLSTVVTWLPATELRVVENKSSMFNFSITNATDSSTIRARCLNSGENEA